MLSERKFHFVFLFVAVLFTSRAKAQIFSFADTSAVIIKTTNQSPAHWYLEITNNIDVDSTLRWKTHFQNIPSEWMINFDTQNQNWPMVMDGDSSDFVMSVNPDFPQKLIIGAMLNNTPGHGIVYFDIFDPANRNEMQTISYEYIVTAAGVGINELSELPFLKFKADRIEVLNGKETKLTVYSVSGQKLLEQTSTAQFSLRELSAQTVLLFIEQDGKNYLIRTLLQ